MYRIIGSDGNQYGPVSAEQVRAWVAEGRANGDTQIQAEGTTEWRRIADFPEFADLAGRTAPPLSSSLPPVSGVAEQMVRGPAIGLIVVAVVGFIFSIGGLGFQLMGAGLNLGALDPNAERITRAFAGTLGVVSTIVSLLLSGLIYWGATKMKTLQNYPLAMTASILAIVPCLSPCCVLGLPLGIWAVIVLAKPEVKSAFH